MKKIGIIIGSFLFMLLLALYFLGKVQESEDAALERKKWVCYLAFKKIAVALCQYAQNEGQGIYYPQTLQELVDKKYISEDILSCTSNLKYQYVPNLRMDMPGNLVLLIETDTPHITKTLKGKENRGFIMFSDLSIYLMVRPGEKEKWLAETHEAINLTQSNDSFALSTILRNTNSTSQTKALALWKLRQFESLWDAAFISNFLVSRSLEVSRQAALLLWKKEPEKSREILTKILATDDSYWVRRDTWKAIFPQDTSLDYISAETSIKKLNEN